MRIFYTCLLSVIFFASIAQQTSQSTFPENYKCGTDIYRTSLYSKDPMLKHKEEINNIQIREQVETLMRNRELSESMKQGTGINSTQGIVYTVPVVVHVMYLPGTPVGTAENISDAAIIQGIQDLNEGFANIGFYTPGTGVDVEIQFCLAKRDPNNQPSTGITRTATTLSNMDMTNDDLSLKNLDRWDTKKYLNIWLVKSICSGSNCSIAGYAYLASAHGMNIDGVVNEATFFGSSKNNSKVHIHEVGHYFNLNHTFEGGCVNNNCLTDGDMVCDTPPDNSTAYSSCSSSANSCTTDADDVSTNNPFRPIANGGVGDQNDMIQNYMDYSSQSCQDRFTQGQKDRMRTSLIGIRASLLSSVGCNPAAAPVSDFTASSQSQCTGNSITFNDQSSNGPTNWSWSFPGGNPSTSTLQNPSVVYSTPGSYNVSLTTSNSLGSGTTQTKSGYITIYSSPIAASCTPATIGTTEYAIGIYNVTLNTINKSTQSAVADGGYQNFTCTDNTVLLPSSTYTLSVKVGPQNNESIKVYIDYNNNGIFTDAGELVYQVNGVLNTQTTTFTTPANPVTGKILRMRVLDDFVGVNGPCTNLNYGQAEDYGVIFSAPAGSPPVANFSASATSVCAGSSVVFNDQSTNTPTSWAWTFTGGTPSTSTVQNPTINYSTAGTYNVSLTVSNAGGNNIKTVNGYITVNALPIANAGNDVSSCSGSSVQLSASGGGTYTWTPSTGLSSSIISNPIATPTATTNYTVKVTNTSGCTATDVVIVSVASGSSIIANAGSDVSICKNSSTTLQATGGATYSWSPATGLSSTTIANPVASPTITTTYTVTVSDATGCPATDAVVVTVKNIPTANAGADVSVCNGASVQLQASGGLAYSWSPITGLSSATVSNPDASPTTSTTYTVKVTDGSGCSATDAVVVTIGQLPTANAGADVNICKNGSTTLQATGGVTYSWTPATGLSNTAIANPVATPTISTIYSVTVTNASGCTASDVMIVSVKSAPTANAGSDSYICKGGTASLYGSGSAGVTYSWAPVATLNNPAISNPVATPTVTTSYTLTVTNTSGCTATDVMIVTVSPLPIANAGADVSFCPGGSAQLQASGGSIYSWNPSTGLDNSSVSNPVAYPSSTTTYTVTVTDDNGCKAADAVVVMVGAGITANAGPDVAVCKGSSTQLNATGGNSYSWSPATGLSSTTIANPVATPTVTTAYTVSVSSPTCPGVVKDIVVVTVNALPLANAGADVTLCSAGSSTTLTASGGISYVWTPATSLSSSTIANPVASPTVTTTYSVVVTDANGCSASDNVLVSVGLGATVNAGADVAICKGASTQLNASGGTTYSWSPAAGLSSTTIANPIASPTVTTSYTVTAGNGSCSSSDIVIVNVNQLPLANAGTDVMICSGGNTTLNASGGTSYVWTPATALSSSTIANPVASPATTTTYTVQVTDANGCKASDAVVVSIGSGLTANAGIDVAICKGSSTQLNAVGGTNYTWSPSAGLSASTIANPIASPTVTTAYTVTATSGSCSGTDVVIVNVNNLPNANAGSDVTICSGGNTTLGASGGTNYVWTPATALSSAGVSNPIASPTVTTTYSVLVTDANGCTASDNVLVSVSSGATVNAGADVAVCKGSSTQLNATGGTSYTWSPSAGLSASNIANPIASPTVTTTYTVTSGSGSCATSDVVIVTVNALPIVNAGPDVGFCNGGSATLNGSGNGTYSWSPSTGLSSTTIANPIANPLTTTTYTLTVSSNGCQATDVAVVNVSSANANAGADVQICKSATVQLNGSGGVSYSWYPATGLSNAFIANPVVNTTTSRTYTLTVTDAYGCTGSDNVNVTVSTATATGSAGSDFYLCPGGTATLLGSGGVSYSWTPATGLNATNVANPVCTPTVTTTYTLAITNNYGCVKTDVMVVYMSTPANPVISQTGNTLTCNGGGAYFTWYLNGQYLTSTYGPDLEITQQGFYTVNVITDYGCKGTANYTVTNLVITGINTLAENNIAVKYNNPVSDELVLTINSTKSQTCNLIIYNSVGQEVYVKNLALGAGESIHTVSVEGLSNGVYSILLKNAQLDSRNKLIINK